MNALYGIAGFLAVYITLLARSAWIQGEFWQFARAVGVVACLLAVIVAIAYGYQRLTD